MQQEVDESRIPELEQVVSVALEEARRRGASQSEASVSLQKGLTATERLILILYYYEEMTMKEIGLTLDLSESRVSQMHSAIVDRLRFQLR